MERTPAKTDPVRSEQQRQDWTSTIFVNPIFNLKTGPAPSLFSTFLLRLDQHFFPTQGQGWTSTILLLNPISSTVGLDQCTSSQTSSYGLKSLSSSIESQNVAWAEGGITIWRTHDASNTYIKAKRYRRGSSGNLGVGSYHNGTSDVANGLVNTTTGTTLITIPIGSDDVSGGATITATVTAISGTLVNYSPTSPNGYGEADDISGTGASLLAARGGTGLEVSPGDWPQYVQTKWLVQLSASATGYDTTPLNDGTSNAGILCWQLMDVTAEQY